MIDDKLDGNSVVCLTPSFKKQLEAPGLVQCVATIQRFLSSVEGDGDQDD